MTLSAREWLPVGVLDSPRVAQALEEVIAAWSATWFARAKLRIARRRVVFRETRGDIDGGWRIWRGRIGVAATAATHYRLAEWGLDVRLDGQVLSRADELIVESLQTRLMQDLVERMELRLGVEGAMRKETGLTADPFGQEGGLELVLEDGDGFQALLVAIPAAVLAAPFKAAIAAPRPRERLAPAGPRLASTLVTVEVTLGRADILLSDLRGLVKGDVVVLNRRLDEAVEVSPPGGGPGLRGKLIDEDGRFALILQGESEV